MGESGYLVDSFSLVRAVCLGSQFLKLRECLLLLFSSISFAYADNSTSKVGISLSVDIYCSLFDFCVIFSISNGICPYQHATKKSVTFFFSRGVLYNPVALWRQVEYRWSSLLCHKVSEGEVIAGTCVSEVVLFTDNGFELEVGELEVVH